MIGDIDHKYLFCWILFSIIDHISYVEIYEEHIEVTTSTSIYENIKTTIKKTVASFCFLVSLEQLKLFLLQQWCFLLCFLLLWTLPFLQLPTVVVEEENQAEGWIVWEWELAPQIKMKMRNLRSILLDLLLIMHQAVVPFNCLKPLLMMATLDKWLM